MNVLEGIDALKNGLMWVGLSALAAIAVGVIGAWLCRGVASATYGISKDDHKGFQNVGASNFYE